MTLLSINLNKIALLRNSRGRDYPSVVGFAQRYIELGVRGITIHPRPDERHITRQDTVDLAALLGESKAVEFNIEGYPSPDFIDLVKRVKPTQCTLVPDSPTQITSDHGWDLTQHFDQVRDICTELSDEGIRSALFLDPVEAQIDLAAKAGANRIELYTEEYAATFGTQENDAVLEQYKKAAQTAQQVGLGLNAGHDLDSANLPKFLQIEGILEVSIGHALTVECIENGMIEVINKYLNICADSK